MEELEYPNIECDRNPGVREPGYCVCDHVEKRQDIFHFERATPKEMGIICCEACYEFTDDPRRFSFNFHVACATCLRRQGLLPGYETAN